jgi:asparagine synthase (glutamine-hydrolysing)
MCGIAGFIHRNECTPICQEIENLSHDNQSCRGPDSKNSWKETDELVTYHLFHQRLRIQDLSPAADQPMHSKMNEKIHIVYNGEIYNPSEVKEEFMPNIVLQTHSDTEILIESLASFDMIKVLNVVRGMFAIGYVDTSRGTLDLVRDYFGEKPLHYAFGDDYIIFASQFDTIAESLKKFGEDLVPDQESIYKYLMMGYFPLGSSLFKKILKVQPGSFVRFNLNSKGAFNPEINHWTLPWVASTPIKRPIMDLESALSSAVSEQLISDVPVGVFLSGGVDSTLVSALAQRNSPHSIHSFSLGFTDSEFDESKFALQASRELGTNHHAMFMSSNDALDILPDVLRAYPEPLGDPSVFPTIFISREASKIVTVVLTGDGADELFFGYSRYARFLEIKLIKNRFRFLTVILKRTFNWVNPERGGIQNRIARMSLAVSTNADIDTYLSLVAFTHFKPASDQKMYESVLMKLKKELSNSSFFEIPQNDLRTLDVRTYLADNILVKVDRAAMAFGLETRVPFLNQKVAMISSSAQLHWLDSNEQKHALKEILSQYVSEYIFRRKKMGFGAPIGEWLRTSLKPWGEQIVYQFNWESIGVNPEYVQQLWNQNQASKDKSATHLWSLLALGASLDRFK